MLFKKDHRKVQQIPLNEIFGGAPAPSLILVEIADGRWYLLSPKGVELSKFTDLLRESVDEIQTPSFYPSAHEALRRAKVIIGEVYPGQSLEALDKLIATAAWEYATLINDKASNEARGVPMPREPDGRLARKEKAHNALMSAVIGRPEEYARVLCERHGFVVRVVETCRTLESKEVRCNLRINAGLVVEAYIG